MDEFDIPLYKMLGPQLVMIMVGLFFLGLFVGGFYWSEYMLPAMHGPWEIPAPGKYLVMAAFLLFSIAAITVATPLSRYKKLLTIVLYAGLILFAVGGFIPAS